MTIKRLVLGAVLGAALVAGFWTTMPATTSAQAGPLGSLGPNFNCALAGPNGTFLFSRFNLPLVEAVVLLRQGWTCIPTAADDAAPRFQCTPFGFISARLSQATAIIRVGGSCVPSGLPPLASP